MEGPACVYSEHSGVGGKLEHAISDEAICLYWAGSTVSLAWLYVPIAWLYMYIAVVVL